MTGVPEGKRDCLSKHAGGRNAWETHLDSGSPGKVQCEQLCRSLRSHRNKIDNIYEYLGFGGCYFRQYLVVTIEGFYSTGQDTLQFICF